MQYSFFEKKGILSDWLSTGGEICIFDLKITFVVMCVIWFMSLLMY